MARNRSLQFCEQARIVRGARQEALVGHGVGTASRQTPHRGGGTAPIWLTEENAVFPIAHCGRWST